MTSNICMAKTLRDKNVLKEIPKDRPGYYKWWATEDDVIAILDKLGVSHTEAIDNMNKKEFFGEVRYCIYIGIAVSESLKSRLNHHVNGANIEVSTLRKTLCGLFGTTHINAFIDRLVIEYFPSDNAIKSQEAKEELHNIERAHLKDNLYILNIQENNHPLASAPKKKLKALRKQAKKI